LFLPQLDAGRGSGMRQANRSNAVSMCIRCVAIELFDH
jgi:hypothetical protein